MKKLFIFFFLFSFLNLQANSEMEEAINTASQYAKKGIYWALSNISTKKSKLDGKLIEDNKLLAVVKVSKEINGIKIESTGFYKTYEVTIVVYRSYESLVADKYINKVPGD